MGRKAAFVVTHPGSDWERLVEQIDRTPRFHCFSTGSSYHHPDDLPLLYARPHKRRNSAAVWVDVIKHPKDLGRLMAFHSRCIFWCAPSDPTVSEEYHAYCVDWMRRLAPKCKQFLWNPDLEGQPDLLAGF